MPERPAKAEPLLPVADVKAYGRYVNGQMSAHQDQEIADLRHQVNDLREQLASAKKTDWMGCIESAGGAIVGVGGIAVALWGEIPSAGMDTEITVGSVGLTAASLDSARRSC